jgi:DNA repair protein RecO (recombination protein O)
VPLVSVRALVLQAMPYSETSRILRLYTEALGLRSVIAKGARRPKSRFGGVLEPFTEGVAAFFLRDGRDLHTLSGFDLVRSRQALGRSLVGFAGASVLAEIVLRAGTEEPHPEVYHALVDALDLIAAAPDDASREYAALAGAWRLIAHLGFEPQLEACVVCGREIADEEPVRFDAVAGGVACTRCRPVGRVLDRATRAEVRGMLAGVEAAAPGRPRTHRALLKAFVEAQIAIDRPLRSFELFVEGAEDPELP